MKPCIVIFFYYQIQPNGSGIRRQDRENRRLVGEQTVAPRRRLVEFLPTLPTPKDNQLVTRQLVSVGNDVGV